MDSDRTESEVTEEIAESRGGLAERVARIEGILEQVVERLNYLEQRLNHVEQTLESRFNGVLYVLIGVWATVVVGFAGLVVAILTK